MFYLSRMDRRYLDLNKVIQGKLYNKVTNEHTGAQIFVGIAHIVSKHNEPLRVKFLSGNVTAPPRFFTYYDSNKKPNLFTEAFSGGKRKTLRKKRRHTRR